MARITVVCAGHLSTCPRMVKAADALAGEGHDVRVVSSILTSAWGETDRRLHAHRVWRWAPVDATRAAAPLRWLLSGGRMRAATRIADALQGRVPRAVAMRAYSRMHSELERAILAEPTDLVYAGTSGAIGAALDAAGRAGVPCGVDFEDFHCGEADAAAPGGALVNTFGEAMMADATMRAAFLTAGSAAIAAACGERFGRTPLPIDNVFPLPTSAPAFARAPGPLRIYWFSQTIGRGRGIEDVVHAAARASVPCELHLRGAATPGYIESLRRCAAATSGGPSIAVHEPVDPDDMVASCGGFDVGVSAEQGQVPNRMINLPNKALTYPLAGLALILTKTLGQRALGESLGGEAIEYEPGDVAALAEGLRRWARDTASLRRSREASWEAARLRWHWEHPLERDALLAAFAGCL